MVLFIVNAIAFALLLARVAGSLDWTVYGICVACLRLLGVGTLVFVFVRFLFRFPIPGETNRAGLRGVGIRIQESTTHALAWLSLGMGYLMAREFQRGTVIPATLVTCTALLLVRLFRRYIRWRALCLRREAGGRHEGT